LNYSIKLLKDGELLLIFGEGTRNLKKELLPLKAGFAFLSIKAKVPVIPVYITETEDILTLKKFRPKVTVKFGKPIFCNSIKEFVVKATQALENLSWLWGYNIYEMIYIMLALKTLLEGYE